MHFLDVFFSGPSKWVESYPLAKGPRQSPIDIPNSCQSDSKLNSIPLNFEYETRGKMLINTGAGFKVNFDRLKKSSKVSV
jgi:carbonic anhydrase